MIPETGLSEETEQTIIKCALRFDGYAYVQVTNMVTDEVNGLHKLHERLQQEGLISSHPLENFACNFALHRGFYQQGTLPEQFSSGWLDMAFYYLHLYRLPTPAQYRHALAAEWDGRTKGAAERAAGQIRMLLRRSQ